MPKEHKHRKTTMTLTISCNRIGHLLEQDAKRTPGFRIFLPSEREAVQYLYEQALATLQDRKVKA